MPGSSTGSEPTPASAPSSAPEPRRSRAGAVAFALALAAAASSWNPLGAPFALVAGAGAAIIALRALRRRGPRRLTAAALALGAGAAVAAVLVLLAAAGLGVGPAEELGVDVRGPGELQRVLDEAAGPSREARERARGELEQLPDHDAPRRDRERPPER